MNRHCPPAVRVVGVCFPKSMSSLGPVALVTGAGSGIGRHTALALLQHGYRVTLVGRRVESLEETVGLAGSHANHATVSPTDVTHEASVVRLFQDVGRRWGRLDLLFNNAGVSAPVIPFEDLSLEQWHTVVDASLTGAFLCTREAFKLMKSQAPQGGRIINNGSVSAHSPRPLSAPYTAAKHGITGLTKSTLLDGRKYNIACGQIDIGNAATDMTRKMSTGVLQADGSVDVEPRIDVAHIVRAVLYMASLPLEANVPFITVMATHMPWVGRG